MMIGTDVTKRKRDLPTLGAAPAPAPTPPAPIPPPPKPASAPAAPPASPVSPAPAAPAAQPSASAPVSAAPAAAPVSPPPTMAKAPASATITHNAADMGSPAPAAPAATQTPVAPPAPIAPPPAMTAVQTAQKNLDTANATVNAIPGGGMPRWTPPAGYDANAAGAAFKQSLGYLMDVSANPDAPLDVSRITLDGPQLAGGKWYVPGQEAEYAKAYVDAHRANNSAASALSLAQLTNDPRYAPAKNDPVTVQGGNYTQGGNTIAPVQYKTQEGALVPANDPYWKTHDTATGAAIPPAPIPPPSMQSIDGGSTLPAPRPLPNTGGSTLQPIDGGSRLPAPRPMGGNTGIVPPSSMPIAGGNATAPLTGDEVPYSVTPQRSQALQTLLGGLAGEANRQLANPSVYDDQLFKDAQSLAEQDLDESYGTQKRHLEGDLAKRGLNWSTVAAGDLSDLDVSRQRALDSSRNALLRERATSIGGARAAAFNNASSVAGTLANQEGNERNELRNERGYNDDLRNTARDQAIQEQGLDSALQSQAENEWQQYLAQALGYGYQTPGLGTAISAQGQVANQYGAQAQNPYLQFLLGGL